MKDAKWYYLDMDDSKFGPFTSKSMHEWARAGYFDSSLRCALSSDGPYLELSKFYPDMEKCFLAHPAL